MIKLHKDIYIIGLKVLERNLGFNGLIYRAADDAINLIEEYKLLEDIQVLKDTAENLSFARKLSKVKTSSPIFSLKIPVTEVLVFIKNTEVLTGKFKFSTDGNRIRLDTKKSKETFIKLLNDSFLHSELTKQYYDTITKDKMVKDKV